MDTALLLASSLGTLYILQKVIEYWKAIRSINNHPGYRTFFSPQSAFSVFLPTIRGVVLGRNFQFVDKYHMFDYSGCDISSHVSAWPAQTRLYIADAETLKEICASRSRFPKPVQYYDSLSVYGSNIVASEGDEWKKYRKISAPSFSDKNNKLVWDETVNIMESLFTDVWGNEGTVTTENFVQVTASITLFVIGAAGFGRPISWKDDDKVPDGHKITFGKALRTVTTNVILKLAIPTFALGFTQHLRDVSVGFDELGRYMKEMVDERQSMKSKAETYDLFSSLLDANDVDTSDNKLGMSELIGNIFVFFLAGHETTAHTLCFTFALLALYPDVQETLHEHVQSILSSGKTLTYENMPLFTHSFAVFNETLRMFPIVTGIPKISAEDTTLTTVDTHGNKVIVPVPKGTDITIHTPGLHYNPRYWDDPHAFKPARFLGDWPRDAFLPFSGGARACLGRKFAETEAVVIITMLIARYRVEIKEEPQFAHETFAQRKRRVLATRQGLSLTPIRVPLVFKSRASNKV